MLIRIGAWLLIVGAAVICVFTLCALSEIGSHTPGKDHTAELQIKAIEEYSSYHRDDLMKAGTLDNSEFVKITGLRGSIFKFRNGEVLDPWGQPYFITRKDDQISVISPGLDRYNNLPWYQRIFQ